MYGYGRGFGRGYYCRRFWPYGFDRPRWGLMRWHDPWYREPLSVEEEKRLISEEIRRVREYLDYLNAKLEKLGKESS